MREFKGRVISPGETSAEAVVSHGGLNTLASFQKALQFGDKKATCGDQNNPDLYGKQMAGRALCLPQTIGSTTGGLVLYCACAMKRQPACMLFSEPIDSLAAAGAVLADVWLDDVSMPVVDSLGEEFLAYVQDGMTITVCEGGVVEAVSGSRRPGARRSKGRSEGWRAQTARNERFMRGCPSSRRNRKLATCRFVGAQHLATSGVPDKPFVSRRLCAEWFRRVREGADSEGRAPFGGVCVGACALCCALYGAWRPASLSRLRRSARMRGRASVAQGIEHRSPKAGAVRSNRTGGTIAFSQARGRGCLWLVFVSAGGRKTFRKIRAGNPQHRASSIVPMASYDKNKRSIVIRRRGQRCHRGGFGHMSTSSSA